MTILMGRPRFETLMLSLSKYEGAPSPFDRLRVRAIRMRLFVAAV
jgi:hypothetical protein